jgi:hypothetical protein
MTPEAAATLVTESSARLWSPEGADALAYLTGRRRCLTPGAIRDANLGWAPHVRARTKDGRPYTARGVVVPWYAGGVLTLVKVRQAEGVRPKYAEVYRDRDRHSGIYPSPSVIRPGQPLIITEGEFDALVLAQELEGLAAVVTLGSASARPTPAILGGMLAAFPWYVATDEDAAGEKAAGAWPASARRVRPPAPYKDWTEAKAAGVDLARWWADRLGGNENPLPSLEASPADPNKGKEFSPVGGPDLADVADVADPVEAAEEPPDSMRWEEFYSRRWGDAAEDPEGGVDNPGRRPSLETLQAATAGEPELAEADPEEGTKELAEADPEAPIDEPTEADLEEGTKEPVEADLEEGAAVHATGRPDALPSLGLTWDGHVIELPAAPGQGPLKWVAGIAWPQWFRATAEDQRLAPPKPKPPPKKAHHDDGQPGLFGPDWDPKKGGAYGQP